MNNEFEEIKRLKQEEIANLGIRPMGKLKEHEGQQFGRWFVLGRGPEKDCRHPKLWCICSCPEHNIKLVDVGGLRRGSSSSCGCERKEKARQHLSEINNKKSCVGQQFGDFKVIEKTNIKQSRYYVYKCKCVYCGRERFINTGHLYQNANVCNCQISGGSSFERKVEEILKENKVFFLREKSFDSFFYEKTKRKPRFDFYLPNSNCLIEIDGEQHFREFSLSKYSLKEIQEMDAIKNKWALSNGYTLIRIPYYAIKTITIQDLLPETSSYIVKE